MKKLHLFLLLLCAASLYAQQPDFLTKYIDPSVKPGDNFFYHALGKWMKENPIPESERGWSIGNLIEEENYSRLHGLLEDAAKGTSPKGSTSQKLGDFYYSGMDTVAIEKAGLSPISEELDAIRNAKSVSELITIAARHRLIGVNSLFGLFVDQDAMNSSVWTLYFWQGGIGLPRAEYYFRADARTENIRKEYKLHIGRMLQFTGVTAKGEDIYAIEKFLADSSRKMEDLRDPYANYNKMSYADFKRKYSAIDWDMYLKTAGVPLQDTVVVGQPEFFARLNQAVTQFPAEVWKQYFTLRVLSAFADRLTSAVDKERFYFRGTVMSGIKVMRPRWKRIQDATEEAMSELLGRLYVEKYYSPATKKRYEKLTDDIIQAYRERIQQLDWMSPETKTKALAKLNSIIKKVGYPETWKDFSGLQVVRNNYCLNTKEANKFWYFYNLNKLGKPVDRTEWNITPQIYNAYYNPSNNEIVMPAAIFAVPGIADSLLDDAFVYAYAGASTIGHELTHGFDDQGRQYDQFGNLNNWWTKEDEDKFTKKADMVVQQFDEFVALDSMHINGKATLGENIADLGGVALGYHAFKKTGQYKEGKSLGGYTADQRFWLGYAYAWLGHKRPEALAQQIMTDVHSPEYLRVNGPLANFPEFHKAFGIKDGDAMYRSPGKQITIW